MGKREEKERTQISQTGISSRGFTLIEIIVVIFIISISLAIVFPSITLNSSLKSEAKRLGSILKYVLDEATSKKQTLSITVKMPEKRLIYELPEGKKEEYFPHLEEIKQATRGTIINSSLTIFFYPSGVKDIFIFNLKNHKETYEVKINPINNRVTVKPEDSNQ